MTNIRFNWMISFIVLLLTGCHRHNVAVPEAQPLAQIATLTSLITQKIPASPDTAQKQETSDTLTVMEADSEMAELPLDTTAELESDWAGLSNPEKLDSAGKLLDAAVTWQEDGDMLVAEYYYERVRDLIGYINPADPEINPSDYENLLADIQHFYRDFIAGLEFLPEESSPEAVFAGIEIAEGDTLNGENDIVDRSEVSLEMTNLDSLLALKVLYPPIPMSEHYKVSNAVEFFCTKGRKVFSRWMERAEYYIPLIQKILKEEGLPEDLVYLSMIESGFNYKAYSYAHASGPWQFIRSTGKLFGLNSDWWYDERRDPVRSTRSAAKYLKKLYLEFNDWYLALAAYNCGERKIHRHIVKYKTSDFWNLRRLPKQTRNYVPTFLAAVTIARDPAKFGFDDIVLKNPPPYDSVLVTECTDLKLIADMVDTTYESLKDLNPMIVRWCTPPAMDSIWVNIPQGKAEQFYQKIVLVPKEQKRSWVRHKVRRGETLSTIARRYGVSMSAIKDVPVNNINRRNVLRAGQELVIPVPLGKHRETWTQDESEEPVFPPETGKKTVYTVRQGDNLYSIARKLGVSVSSLKRWNNLWGKKFIYPGQKLVFYARGKSNSSSASIVGEPGTGKEIPRFHRVQPGESLWLITKKYGLSYERLLALNGLSRNSIIRPGDELILRTEATNADNFPASTIIYTVKRGDTLWSIANSFGVRVSDLKAENGIDGNAVIKPGDKLKISR